MYGGRAVDVEADRIIKNGCTCIPAKEPEQVICDILLLPKMCTSSDCQFKNYWARMQFVLYSMIILRRTLRNLSHLIHLKF